MDNNKYLEIEKTMLNYEFGLNMLETELKILIKEYEVKNHYNPVEHIKTRIKTKDSIIKKLEKKKYEVNSYNIINHIHDIIGIRLVCSFIPDVYNIVNIIKNSKLLTIKDEKDYIKNPKDTGYISYHLIVLVPIYLHNNIEYIEAEIQIRTIAMDFWASLEHKIQYKFSESVPEEVKNELYQCSLDIKNLDNKMYQLNEIVKKYKD